jgi:hypothetical protein
LRSSHRSYCCHFKMRKFGGKLKNPLKVTWIVSGQTRMFLDAGPVLHIYLDSFWEGLHWPEVIKSSAAGIPMSLGRSWVPLAPGRIPSVTSGKPVSVCQRLQVERPLQWHNIWRLKTSMPKISHTLSVLFHPSQPELPQG